MLVTGVAALIMGLAAGIIGTRIPAQAAPAVNYVALGDSYASGVGAGSVSGSCGQSPNAYPALWATASSPASFKFAACSGATTSDVISSQLSSLSSSTTLVSMTIGGNDLDGVIQTAAANNGDTFADVRSQFSGHELCDGSSWLHSVTLPIGNSYHPTATGQKDGYLLVFSATATKVGQ
jgi:lysophospholipase L1-like esterase